MNTFEFTVTFYLIMCGTFNNDLFHNETFASILKGIFMACFPIYMLLG